MKRAKLNGKLIEAGPDAPKRAECPHCGAEVLLRRRKTMDGVTWYWRHINGQALACPARARVPGVYIDDKQTNSPFFSQE